MVLSFSELMVSLERATVRIEHLRVIDVVTAHGLSNLLHNLSLGSILLSNVVEST